MAFNDGTLTEDGKGEWRDCHGMAAENFGLMDNLMLDWAVRAVPGRHWALHRTPESERYTSLAAFKVAVRIMVASLA
jgi:hypothetical protein